MALRRYLPIRLIPILPIQVYDFQGGVDTYTANENLKTSASPYARNVRYKSRETIQTRKGPGFYSVAVGQTQNASQTGATIANQTVSLTTKQAAKFTATATGSLTRVDLNLESTTPAGTGPVIVEIYSDNAGSPGTLLASSSITGGLITGAYQYLPALFLNPPTITNTSVYWIVAYIQSDGTNSYLWGSVAGSSSKANINLAGWTAQSYDLNFITYLSPTAAVIGGIRFYQSSGTKATIFATSAGVYTVNDITGAVTLLWAGNTSATNYVFEQFNDNLYWVNGFDAPQQYNGTVVTAVPGSPGIASYVKLHKNTLFFVMASDPTRVIFSQPADPTTYTSVSFLYVPSPKNPDPIKTLTSLQDNLIIRTRQTKWVLYGADLSSFTLRRSTGLQGVTNANGVAAHDNVEYSVTDNGIYHFNGSTDTLVSQSIQPDFDAIIDKTKCTLTLSGNYLRVFYPTAGSAYNNMAFVIDLLYGTVFIDDSQYFGRAFVMKGQGDPETLVLASGIVGAVYYADMGYSDLGAAIAFDYRTKYESYGEIVAKKKVRRLYPEFTGQGGNYSCSVSVDFNMSNAPQLLSNVSQLRSGPLWGTFVWGAATWGAFGNIRPRLSVPSEFYTRQYRFQHTGVNHPVELVGFSDYYLKKRPR